VHDLSCPAACCVQNFSADTICERLADAGVPPSDMLRLQDPRRRVIEVSRSRQPEVLMVMKSAVGHRCHPHALPKPMTDHIHVPVRADHSSSNIQQPPCLPLTRLFNAISTAGAMMQALPSTLPYSCVDPHLKAFKLPNASDVASKKVGRLAPLSGS
jgi:hypothetical protein